MPLLCIISNALYLCNYNSMNQNGSTLSKKISLIFFSSDCHSDKTWFLDKTTKGCNLIFVGRVAWDFSFIERKLVIDLRSKFHGVIIIDSAVKVVLDRKLSNDPDKNCSIFYCSAAICFPHVEIVVFSYAECINWWEAGLWNKMHLNSILKGSFLCVQTFQPITVVLNKDNKSFQVSNVPLIRLLWYLDSEKIPLKGR